MILWFEMLNSMPLQKVMYDSLGQESPNMWEHNANGKILFCLTWYFIICGTECLSPLSLKSVCVMFDAFLLH